MGKYETVNGKPALRTTGGGGGGGGSGTSDTTEATQLLVKEGINQINADIGDPSDAAASADGSGNYGVIAALKRSLLNGASILARLPNLISGRVPTVDAAYDPIFGKLIVGNARAKIRDGFDTFDVVNIWEPVQTGTGDVISPEGNASGASYVRVTKSPLNANTETILLSRKTFKLPVRVALAATMSQRIAGQEFYFDLVGVDANGGVVSDAADAAISVTGVTTSTTTWTFTTATPHGYVVGDIVQPFGFADSRFNTSQVSNAIVTGTPAPTTFTITAANLSNASAGAGQVLRVRPSGNALESAGYRWSGVTAANANPYTRSGASSVYLGNEVAFGATNSVVPAGYNVANSYAHSPSTSFEIRAQIEAVHWASIAMDSATAPVISKRMQSLPSIERDYKLRIRARNLPNLTIPVGKITAASKTGTTTATLTVPNHGLTNSDQVVVYGVRDQASTSFPNVTAATAITVVDANTIQIVQGTAGTAASAGGYVARVQGGVTSFGGIAQAVQTISRASGQITVIGSAAWTGVSIGEYVVLYGMDGGGAGYNGTYRVASVSGTSLILDAAGPDFGAVNCGGGVIKATDFRLHYARVIDYTRLLTEVVGGFNPRDANAAVPVAVQPNSDPLSVTVASGTVTTVSALTGGGVAEDAAAGTNPVLTGGVVRTAVAPTTLIAGDAARATMTSGAALVTYPFAVPEVTWQYTGVLTTTTAAAAKAAGAASIRNYVASLQYQNTSATATTVLVLDGATTIAQFNAPANMAAPATVSFDCPIKGTAATALNVNCGTAAANVLINVQGFQSL